MTTIPEAETEALNLAVIAYDEARCASQSPFEQPMSDRNRETIAPMIAAAIAAYNAAVKRVNRATDTEIGGIHRTFSATSPASADRKRQIAANIARGIGQELSSESADLCECGHYGCATDEDCTPYLRALTQRGEDLIAKYIERAIQMDREGKLS